MGNTEGDSDIEDTQTLNVADLTKGMKQLNDASYRKFFRLYYRRLWAYLFVMTNGNESDIEDVMQLVFTNIVKGIKVFTTENSFWSWLAIVARNAYFDFYRKDKSYYRIKDRIRSYTDTSEQFYEADYNLDDQKLNKALDRLDETERYLINRKYFEGGSYREIATELKETERAVESRLARLRGKLRLLLLEEN